MIHGHNTDLRTQRYSFLMILLTINTSFQSLQYNSCVMAVAAVTPSLAISLSLV
jgi:hypothetical protein